MENILDMFNSDAFSLTELSKAIDLVPIKWGRIGELNLFPEDGVPTTSVSVEFRNNELTLLPTKRRGEPASAGGIGRRSMKSFNVPHIPHEDRVTSEDFQNLRQFGTLTLETLQNTVNRKLLTMANKHDITLEHMRAGMTQGKLLDADGTVLLNVFTEFGVTEPLMYFDFDNAAAEDIVADCNAIKRWIEDHLLGDVTTGIRALCSPGFWDKFITSEGVVESYRLYTSMQNINPLRDDVRKGFKFQDILWEEYRAKGGYKAADGTITTTQFIPDGEVRFVPEGTVQTFATFFGPSTFLEGVNQPGMKRFAKAVLEDGGRWVDLLTQSNPLPLCMKPAVLVRGYAGAGASNI